MARAVHVCSGHQCHALVGPAVHFVGKGIGRLDAWQVTLDAIAFALVEGDLRPVHFLFCCIAAQELIGRVV